VRNGFDFAAGEIININKPAGLTSFQVVKKIRDCFKIDKVGHAGTLDPFATGVLLILTGKATRQSQALADLDKQYLAEVEFGCTTDTLDVDGRIVAHCYVMREYSREEILQPLASFIGQIEQEPPMYSAIKVKGLPLYKYARRGEKVTPRPRQVRIDSIQLVAVQWPIIRIDVTCSKGTYIRSLARDLGVKLGTGAHLKSLIRTRIGNYRIENAFDLERFLRIGVVETGNDSSATC